METIKIYGLQRSGTTYLREALKANITGAEVLANEGGWKHGDIGAGLDCTIIVIAKCPYSWAGSIDRWARKTGWPEHERRLPFYMNLWNTRYASYAKALTEPAAKPRFYVRYEDLLSDFDFEMRRISLLCGVELEALLRNPTKVEQSGAFTEADRQRYLAPKRSKAVRELVDWGVARKFGYLG